MAEKRHPLLTRITVAVDAMGGDLAPHAVVTGALDAARLWPEIDIILVGDTAAVQPLLTAAGAQPPNVTCRHTTESVGMCEAPVVAIRQKRDSSMAVGTRMVRDGEAHAIISAGNSGAMMAAGMLILKPQPGIDRPAIASPLPAKQGFALLLDAGANTDCKPINLLQFAHLGSTYARTVLELTSPRVGLLSIGEEPSKGDELTKEAHKLLVASTLNFIGNVEPKEVVRGEVDVVVCDGFVGNMVLKAGEGFGEFLFDILKTEFKRNWLTKLAASVLMPGLYRLKKRFDYAEYGGALLLGVNGVMVIGHGRSSALAIRNAIRNAAKAAALQLNDSPATPRHTLLDAVAR